MKKINEIIKIFTDFTSSKTFPLVMFIIFFAVLLLYPVARLIQKANSTATFSLDSSTENFQAQQYELDRTQIMENPYDFLSGGEQPVKYKNTGDVIPVVTGENLRSLRKSDLQNIGATPGAFLNIISTNINDPLTINLIFNSKTVTLYFLKRPSVQTILEDPKQLEKFIMDKKYMNRFFNNVIVKKALENEKVVSAIAKSRLTDYVIRSKAVQYYIKRPKTAKKLAQRNPYFRQMMTNPHIRKEIKAKDSLSSAASAVLD